MRASGRRRSWPPTPSQHTDGARVGRPSVEVPWLALRPQGTAARVASVRPAAQAFAKFCDISWSVHTVQERPMAPRANWKGYLRLSLVSCPIALYPASSAKK
jgi:hypothetical protein